MKYMDKTLTDEEAKKLNLHISNCEMCKCDFFIYDSILEELDRESAIIYELSDDFEDVVMKKIYKLNIGFSFSQEDKLENILNAVLGVFSVLFSLGIILYVYRDTALKWLSDNAYVSGYVKSFVPSFTVFNEYFDGIYSYATSLFTTVGDLISDSRYIFLGICFVLIVIQFIIHNKSKNKVET